MNEDEPQSLQRLFLDLEGAIELILRQQLAADEHVPEAVLQAVTERIGADDFSVEKGHGHGVVFRA